MRRRLRFALAAFATAFTAIPLLPSAALAQSKCLAMAENAPAGWNARAVPAALGDPLSEGEVRIRFAGHSTFVIETPGGVTIATDYAGNAAGVTPQVATMNRAHGSHYTMTPDPDVAHVLRGWGEYGDAAKHELNVGDVYIRNVPTDIRGAFPSERLPDGNSIFIFEVANLCIGHLGHLHHVLAAGDLGWIGQLDIAMVAVDGRYTMDQGSMVETLRVIKPRIILPMHYFGPPTLNSFLARLPEEEFDVEMRAEPEVIVSTRTLPGKMTVMVLPGY